MLKYKSYAVKAATPLGYSIFIQKEREGFSFQRHIEHKLEVFHIVEVKQGGYVFLCDFGDWKRLYERMAFEQWLAGEANAAFERYRFVPRAGDVFIISELGVVHTVVGCVLEEYATVSTDMVERLHDQNAGKSIPSDFNRANAERALSGIEPPVQSRVVQGFDSRDIKTLEPVAIQGGERIILCDSFIRAARYRVTPGEETALGHERDRALTLRISKGSGSVVMTDISELGTAQPRVGFSRGDLILIPPGIHYAVRNEDNDYVEYSEHCISPDVALV
jgi:mannose-6-phosphate isomerase-like protein (cupin superfamily)